MLRFVILIGLFLLGAFAWTFAEYCLHRFDGHERRGKSLFSREHLRHHVEKDYFSPTWMKVLVTTPVVAVAMTLTMLLLGWQIGLALGSGFISMYVVYEIIHYRLHVAAPQWSYARWARKHHFAHHFVNAKWNHGVTIPLWDKVFGTYYHVEKLRVPSRYAMNWLIDPKTNQVKEEFAGDYEIFHTAWRDSDAEEDLKRHQTKTLHEVQSTK